MYENALKRFARDALETVCFSGREGGCASLVAVGGVSVCASPIIRAFCDSSRTAQGGPPGSAGEAVAGVAYPGSFFACVSVFFCFFIFARRFCAAWICFFSSCIFF